jgi:alginate O-acetyltransferase complex protein AlgJ
MTARPAPLTREEQAKVEIGHTAISPGVKWSLCAIGLFTLFAVPFVQAVHETRQYAHGKRGTPWPQCCEVIDALPRAIAAFREGSGGWLGKTLRANAVALQAIAQYEGDLKSESVLTRRIQPPVQEILVRAGAGNEQGYVGRRGWLFYRPGIDACTGPGFLRPRQLARRAEDGTAWRLAPQPDPRVAIVQFHRQLAARDIRLVVMPIPDKATIHPDRFSARYEGQRGTIHNPSYRQFLADLEAEGVLVCEVSGALARHRNRSATPAYLATDTHWRPEAMEVAVRELARCIEALDVLPKPPADPQWRQSVTEVSSLGDLATMLQLREGQKVFGKETVTIRPVADTVGQPWRPDPAAEILVLGDSFANIYSLELLNWGGAAGFVERLGLAMNRPLDAILRNDDGAYATRELLSRELARGKDRLAGKKVVVWQFAARELSAGDWRLLDMTLAHSPPATKGLPPLGREVIVTGTIAARSPAPRAGQIPYAHHIFTLDVIDLEVHSGTLTEPKIAVYLFSMRNHENTPAFSWPVGQRVRLRLQPWSPDFFARYGRINRSETEDVKLIRPWWGEVVE